MSDISGCEVGHWRWQRGRVRGRLRGRLREVLVGSISCADLCRLRVRWVWSRIFWRYLGAGRERSRRVRNVLMRRNLDRQSIEIA